MSTSLPDPGGSPMGGWYRFNCLLTSCFRNPATPMPFPAFDDAPLRLLSTDGLEFPGLPAKRDDPGL